MRGGCEYCGRFRLEQARGSGRVERCDIDAATSGTALTVVQEVTAIWQELRKAVTVLFGLDASDRLRLASSRRHAKHARSRRRREDDHVVAVPAAPASIRRVRERLRYAARDAD